MSIHKSDKSAIELLDIKEAAKALHGSVRSVERLLATGALTVYSPFRSIYKTQKKVGRRLFDAAEVNRLIRGSALKGIK